MESIYSYSWMSMSRWNPIYSWVWVDGIPSTHIYSFYSSRWDLKLWSGGLIVRETLIKVWNFNKCVRFRSELRKGTPWYPYVYNSKRDVKRSWKGPDTWYRRGVGFLWRVIQLVWARCPHWGAQLFIMNQEVIVYWVIYWYRWYFCVG